MRPTGEEPTKNRVLDEAFKNAEVSPPPLQRRTAKEGEKGGINNDQESGENQGVKFWSDLVGPGKLGIILNVKKAGSENEANKAKGVKKEELIGSVPDSMRTA